MKRLAPLLSLFFVGLVGMAQNLSVDVATINYGTVFENLPDSVQVTVTNTADQSIEVTDLKFFETYGQFPFTTTQGNFTLSTGQSQSFWVKFTPDHNVIHNSEMVIVTRKSGAFSVDLQGTGRYQSSYYAPTNDLEEEALKSALKTLLANNYNSLGYNSARDEMYMVIDNKRVNGQGTAQNQFESVYIGATLNGYVSRSNAQNQGYNTEHTFPQGFFSSNEPERSDIHHLFITNGVANSTRGNDPFGIVTTPGWSQGGSKQGGGTFEPRDAQKGPSARAMMYFVTRYQDYANHFAPQENILRQWHADFPPNDIQRQRNEDIFAVQNNRNPYIDYPQLVDRITNLVSNSVAPQALSFYLASDTVHFNTLAIGDTGYFDLVLVNNGNQDLVLSNFAATLTLDQNLFGLPASPLTLVPGEDLTLNLKFVATSSSALNTVLMFNHNLPNSPGVSSVPLVGDVVVNVNDWVLAQPGIEAFPVPASELLHLKSTKAIGRVVVADLSGKVWMQERVPGTTTQLDLSSLASGVYFLQFVDHAAQKPQRIVVSRQ
ncbi:MAG: endonuclease [Salibacteraceae bacterium]